MTVEEGVRINEGYSDSQSLIFPLPTEINHSYLIFSEILMSIQRSLEGGCNVVKGRTLRKSYVLPPTLKAVETCGEILR